MEGSEKLLIFLCSGAAKTGTKKLSYRIAVMLESMGVAKIGSLQHLSEQHAAIAQEQQKMIFINDCRSGCVNVLTQGFENGNYIFFDVSPFLTLADFDIENFIRTEILPMLRRKWK